MIATMPIIFQQLLGLPPEGSTFASDVDWLHFAVITTTLLGSMGVAVVALYWLVRYRQRRPGQLTRRVPVSITTELVLSGGTLTLFIVFWIAGYYIYLDIREPPSGSDALVVYVTAKQWMWKFSYPDGRATNEVLVAPEGRRLKLVMTSRDVIHSFYVPGFRLKQDVLPGRYVTTWFESVHPGEYPILCAEYCGISHSLMRGEVIVLRGEDYARWLEQVQPAGSEKIASLAEYGHEVAMRHECLACHTIDGQPHIGPTWSRLYDSTVPLEGGGQVIADDEYLTRSMMEPLADVVKGYRPVMPTFYGRLTNVEVGALVAFIQSLKDGPMPRLIELPSLDITPDDAGIRDAAPPPPTEVDP